MKAFFVIVGGLFVSLSMERVLADAPKRLLWTMSKITGSPEPPPPYQLERALPALSFKNPTVLTNAPGTDRLFLVELTGKIYSFPTKPETKETDLCFDLKSIKGMRQAYGLTFHPQFKTNRYCYVCYVLQDNDPNGTRVSRFTMSKTEPPRILPESEVILMTWLAGGHNGGCLKFGPDGYLYISTGDGGPAFPPDPLKTGQDNTDLLSCILRIDVDHVPEGKPYGIPKDNPFVNLKECRPEIWSYGLRNPWKMSFDPKTGDLWVGDVGWELWEMIYRIDKGGNYGWSLVEGPQEVHRERKRGPTPILPPTIYHPHTESRSITGGFVYHGSRLKELRGMYIYGDYVTGTIWGLRWNEGKVTERKELARSPLQIIAFGIDNDNELYVVGYDGSLHRMIPNPEATTNRTFPRKLSETGLFRSVKEHLPAEGVIPYSVTMEPWMDGATAERFLAIPGSGKLGVHQKNEVWLGRLKGEWAFPKDSVLVQTISLPIAKGEQQETRRLETRILHQDGVTWQAYSYIWNDEQTDALLATGEETERTFTVPDASSPTATREQTYQFPSRTECLTCHTTRTGSILGFTPELLANPEKLTSLDLLEKPFPKERKRIPALDDSEASLESRLGDTCMSIALTVINEAGAAPRRWSSPFTHALKRTNMIDARPTQGTFFLHDAKVIASGDPYRSVLYYRMVKTGPGHMPHLGSTWPDSQGMALIRQWIQSLPGESTSPIRKQQQEMLARLTRGKETEAERDSLLKALLSTTSGAVQLADAMELGSLSPPVRLRLLELVRAESLGHIRDLLERFLPPDQRVARLGSIINPEKLFALKGDAARGRDLFLKSPSVQCRTCHRVDQVGETIGPDLSAIAKQLDRTQLLESILYPSKRIDPKWVSYLVETKKGLVHTGLLLHRNKNEVVLRTAQGKELRIDANEIELITQQQKSLMPELLLRDLTPQHAADLLEWLSSLKGSP